MKGKKSLCGEFCICYCQKLCFSSKIVRFQNGTNKVAIELRVVQFWSEIILARSFDFEITRIISDQIALHSVQLPLLIIIYIMVIELSGVQFGLKS